MSNGYRNGAFALGLVVGGGITLNLFLWLDYQAQKQANQTANGRDDTDHSQIGSFWDAFLGTFVSPSDTLAQWIMAVFTIAATIVLVFTLRSANKTNAAAIETAKAAAEANQIMRSEQRAWLKVEFKPEVHFVDGNISLKIGYAVRNIGAKPAIATSTWSEIVDFHGLAEESQIAVGSKVLATARKNRHGAKVVFPDSTASGIIRECDINLGSASNLRWLVVGACYRPFYGADETYTIASAGIVVIMKDRLTPLREAKIASHVEVRIDDGPISGAK